MSVPTTHYPLENRTFHEKWSILFAELRDAAHQLNNARRLGRFDDPSGVARRARDLYDFMKETAVLRFIPSLDELSLVEVDLYRSAMSYAHLRATAQPYKQWTALQRLVSLCTLLSDG